MGSRGSIHHQPEAEQCGAEPVSGLRGLFVDADSSAFNDKDFIRLPSEVDDPIFSMMYLAGTVLAGAMHGRWTPPGPSPTNSVLLWPDTFNYFAEKAREVMRRTA